MGARRPLGLGRLVGNDNDAERQSLNSTELGKVGQLVGVLNIHLSKYVCERDGEARPVAHFTLAGLNIWSSDAEAALVSGLHNKFPSYFYKRGNLFNTYLGHTDAGSEPPRTTTGKQKPRRRASQPAAHPIGIKPTPLEELVTFTQQRLTASDAERMLRALAEHVGVRIEVARRREHAQLASFLRSYVGDGNARRYLTELKRRETVGKPLIRH